MPPQSADQGAQRPLMARRHAVGLAVLVAGDCAALAAAGVASGLSASGDLLPWPPALILAWPLLLAAYGLYREDTWVSGPRRPAEARAVLHATLVACVAVAAVAPRPFERLAALGAATAGAILLVRAALRRVLLSRLGPERLLLVAGDQALDALSHGLPDGRAVAHVARVRTREVAGLERELDERAIDHVVVHPRALESGCLAALVAACSARSVRLSLAEPGFRCGVRLVGLRDDVMARARACKRTMDVAGAAGLVVALAPLMALIAVAVRLDSPGPILFRQVRVGRGGRQFVIWKFRTMVRDAEARRAALLALSRDQNWLDLERDPRVTRVGWFLRHTSLDELPQLFNVLRGDMSLVGPRPLVLSEQARVPAWALPRAEVAPGITGAWQVAGRDRIPFEDMLRLDGRYVSTWSLWRDVQILLLTIPAVFTGKGAR